MISSCKEKKKGDIHKIETCGEEFVSIRIDADDAEALAAVLAEKPREIRVGRQDPTLIGDISRASDFLHFRLKFSFLVSINSSTHRLVQIPLSKYG